MTSPTDALRSVLEIVPSDEVLEGGGFVVRRAFPTVRCPMVDPFLLLDQMGPVDYPPDGAIGAPDHPHRGFETVTYLLEGAMRHRDSAGHEGRLGPGSIQWMTAGSGVVHSEMPDPEFLRTGGRMHGFQLWVNLPARAKMTPPRYQDIPRDQIPTATTPDGRVVARVIAGEAMGLRARVDTRTPITFLHFTIRDTGTIDQPFVRSHNVVAYVFQGEGAFGRDSVPASAGFAVRFASDGELVRVAHAGRGIEPLEVLVIAGEPLAEPVARYGPFVMNEPREIDEAVRDYRSGRMGRIT